ncbi:hypothetical protein DEO72_LG10g2403 [Vigna unguiculata]|uniref:Uncharacterized protein n=1 Tax=Vigna unguiculata TaxID=3917 RepID=A0A4D6NB99_VIGUN|nr:hypothetical protein DEO72_LG10g2403 [Vigna unguiculata]
MPPKFFYILSSAACDAPTRWLDSASRSRSGHGRGGAADTCTTRCRTPLAARMRD